MHSILYFNPQCSKCKGALTILEDKGEEPEMVRYLEAPPSKAELEELMTKLGIEDPAEIMRKGEPLFAALRLEGADREQLIASIVANPILLERPIFVRGDRAVIARPPEKLLEIL